MYSHTVSVDLKMSLTSVFINLCIGEQREVKRFMSDKLLVSLIDDLGFQTLASPGLITNIVWTLNNYCSTSAEFRTKITDIDVKIFQKL